MTTTEFLDYLRRDERTQDLASALRMIVAMRRREHAWTAAAARGVLRERRSA